MKHNEKYMFIKNNGLVLLFLLIYKNHRFTSRMDDQDQNKCCQTVEIGGSKH